MRTTRSDYTISNPVFGLAYVGLLAALAATALTSGWPAHAQSSPSFEAATIRPAPPDARGALMNFPTPTRLSVNNFTLRMLINTAYGPELGPGAQVTGGPDWIEKDRYVILGQSQGSPTRAEMIAMLKTLLTERFALKVHTDSKEVDAYALVMARDDRKPGPKLQTWDGTCNGKPVPAAQPGGTGPRCAAFFRPPGLVMRGASIAVLANMLSAPFSNLGRPVVDQTGLGGEYDYDLEVSFAPASPNPAPADAAAPSVFVALQEQLGLKLQPTRTTVKVLVVDNASRPTEN
jgi:uncharacterized protein (TIGR03435 family)